MWENCGDPEVHGGWQLHWGGGVARPWPSWGSLGAAANFTGTCCNHISRLAAYLVVYTIALHDHMGCT